MKKIMLISALFLSLQWLYAQADITPKVQLFIITADHRQLITDSNGIDIQERGKEHIDKGAIFINPSWIESVSVVKGKQAIEGYGKEAKNGIMLLKLRNGALHEMSTKDQVKFRRKI